MSRTRKGSKGPGCDLWSRRPCGGKPDDAFHRKLTARKERALELLELHRAKRHFPDNLDEPGESNLTPAPEAKPVKKM